MKPTFNPPPRLSALTLLRVNYEGSISVATAGSSFPRWYSADSSQICDRLNYMNLPIFILSSNQKLSRSEPNVFVAQIFCYVLQHQKTFPERTFACGNHTTSLGPPSATEGGPLSVWGVASRVARMEFYVIYSFHNFSYSFLSSADRVFTLLREKVVHYLAFCINSKLLN